MATKKDLVEAYSFSRRRLVTAFLSGAPGGREVEPSRPGRTVVGGLALAVLLIAGAAIASVLASRTPVDWNQVGLVTTRGDQPATYVVLEVTDPPQLIPVINITSAQLILGADVKSTQVDEDVIEDETPGIPIGILGAPQTLPKPDRFIQTGWTACTDQGVGIAVDVSEDPEVTRTTSDAVVVRSADDETWLIATSSEREGEDRRAYRYLLSDAVSDQFLVDQGLPQRASATEVPTQWLALFPEGGELGPRGFHLPDFGRPATDSPVPGANVGDYVELDDGRGALVVDGGYQPLDPFALSLLQQLDGPTRVEGTPPTSYEESTFPSSHWPETTLQGLNSQPCAELDVAPGQVPRVWLAGDPQGDAESPEQGSPDQIATDERRVTVDRGHGAFIQDATWDTTTSSSRLVVDPLGKAFPLGGGPITLTNLRYDPDSAPPVPDEWVDLFDVGVTLSTYAALCPPADQPGQQQTDDCQALPQ